MTRSSKFFSNNAVRISSILIVTIIVFLVMLFFSKQYYILNNNINSFKYNEFGDFFGGILNPLFTLLSTVAIIFLTYIIAKGDSRKADKAIETQKRITLNQMRQVALNDLIEKLNLYVYEVDKMSFHDVKGIFHQRVLTRLTKEEKSKGKEKVIVWLIILNELENFIQLEYLFSDLFKKELFQTKYNSIITLTSQLCDEQERMKFINNKTIGEYITLQKELVTEIGNYIYSKF